MQRERDMREELKNVEKARAAGGNLGADVGLRRKVDKWNRD